MARAIPGHRGGFRSLWPHLATAVGSAAAQWNCSDSVEPDSAVVEDSGLTAVLTASK